MAFILKQSSAVDILIGPFLDSTDAFTGETGLTIAQSAVRLSKNGQNMAQKNDNTTCVHDELGYYNCELDATDTDTVGTLVISVAGDATSLPVRHEFQVVEEAVYVDVYAASAAGPSRTTSLTALSQGKPPSTPTLDVAIMHLYWQEVYAKRIVDTGSVNQTQVFAEDASTVLWEADLTDASSIFTKAEVQSGA